jgi:hypothetical protein
MLLSFFTWCENTPLGEAIRGSLWLFPVIESFHLLALAVIGGAVLVVDLRLFGWVLKAQPVEQLWSDTRPWLVGSLAVLIVSGLLLFFSEAIKLYYSDAFWVKMTALVLAAVFTFRVQQPRVLAGRGNRTLALASLVLWSMVGASGRWIGFS